MRKMLILVLALSGCTAAVTPDQKAQYDADARAQLDDIHAQRDPQVRAILAQCEFEADKATPRFYADHWNQVLQSCVNAPGR